MGSYLLYKPEEGLEKCFGEKGANPLTKVVGALKAAFGFLEFYLVVLGCWHRTALALAIAIAFLENVFCAGVYLWAARQSKGALGYPGNAFSAVAVVLLISGWWMTYFNAGRTSPVVYTSETDDFVEDALHGFLKSVRSKFGKSFLQHNL